MRTSFGLPCAHEMTQLTANYKTIDPLDVHVYWRTLHMVGDVPRDEAPRRSTTDDLIDEAVAEIRRQPERQKAMYAHMMHAMLHPATTELEEPQVRRHKGRPKRSSMKRESSDWEYSEERASRQDSALLTRSMSTSSGRGRGRQGDRRVSFSVVEEAQLKGRVLVCPADERRISLSSTDGSQRSTDTSFPYAADMSPGVLPYIRGFVDVIGDGNCGFRVIALSKYGDEHMWDQVPDLHRLLSLGAGRNHLHPFIHSSPVPTGSTPPAGASSSRSDRDFDDYFWRDLGADRPRDFSGNISLYHMSCGFR
ncbi:hypothetical protein Dimus_038284 [Dionaea muscipula]